MTSLTQYSLALLDIEHDVDKIRGELAADHAGTSLATGDLTKAIAFLQKARDSLARVPEKEIEP